MNSLRIDIEDRDGRVLSPVYEVHNIEKAFEIVLATIPLTQEHGSKIVAVKVA